MELPTLPRTTKPNGRQPHHALTTAFVRNLAQAGRYCDDRHVSFSKPFIYNILTYTS